MCLDVRYVCVGGRRRRVIGYLSTTSRESFELKRSYHN